MQPYLYLGRRGTEEYVDLPHGFANAQPLVQSLVFLLEYINNILVFSSSLTLSPISDQCMELNIPSVPRIRYFQSVQPLVTSYIWSTGYLAQKRHQWQGVLTSTSGHIHLQESPGDEKSTSRLVQEYRPLERLSWTRTVVGVQLGTC